MLVLWIVDASTLKRAFLCGGKVYVRVHNTMRREYLFFWARTFDLIQFDMDQLLVSLEVLTAEGQSRVQATRFIY